MLSRVTAGIHGRTRPARCSMYSDVECSATWPTGPQQLPRMKAHSPAIAELSDSSAIGVVGHAAPSAVTSSPEAANAATTRFGHHHGPRTQRLTDGASPPSRWGASMTRSVAAQSPIAANVSSASSEVEVMAPRSRNEMRERLGDSERTLIRPSSSATAPMRVRQWAVFRRRCCRRTDETAQLCCRTESLDQRFENIEPGGRREAMTAPAAAMPTMAPANPAGSSVRRRSTGSR